MIKTDANIYLIKNLKELNCRYWVYQIRGLSPDSADFHRNTQLLVDKLSRLTKSPCIAFRNNEGSFIAQLEGYCELPDTFNLIRSTVKIDKNPKLQELKFHSLDSTTGEMAIKFLQFIINGHLYNHSALWTPKAGAPFFHKIPSKEHKSTKVGLHEGFVIRIVKIENNLIGVCVDSTRKYIAKNTLPTNIPRDEFRRRYKKSHCLYEYGTHWYEIRLDDINDLKADEVLLPDGHTLFNDVHGKAGKSKSHALLALPKDCSVLIYYTSTNEQRNAPSGLCRLVYGTEHIDVKGFHEKTIRPPGERKQEIQFVVDNYLRNLSFGSSRIVLSEKFLGLKAEKFNIPDLKYGNSKVLSVQGGNNTITVSLKDFGAKKREMLYNSDAGLFVRKAFDRQYFILPKSITESFGPLFIEDIKREIQRLNPTDSGASYSPILVSYNDAIQRSLSSLGQEIIKTVEDKNLEPGYGLVMIPEILPRTLRKEDELANYLMRKLRDRELFVTTVHTSTLEESYESVKLDGDHLNWQLSSNYKQRGIYKGYIKNVVLNKILLLNSYWPFVLKTPLNADLTIGIDVKNNTAGFTLVYKSGADIRFFSSRSDQKEQLSQAHVRSKLTEILSKEINKISTTKIKNIVIQRQGRLFPSEQEGICEALDFIVNKDLIPKDYDCTFVDIRRTSKTPFRLFEMVSHSNSQKETVRNPMIGTYVILSKNEGFVCNTGYPFKHKGTTRPLHVIKIDGGMPIKLLIQDIFYLSNLTWTKIDDCARDPITIKLNDIRLREIAGEYDLETFEFNKKGA